jgi:hypothetical protein
LLSQIGFRSVSVKEHFYPFVGTSKERVALKYGVTGVNVHAIKA